MAQVKAGDVVRLLVSIVICQLAGFLGSLFTTPSIPTWYVSLNRPSFAPPSWLFSPVWILLFLFMGISLFLVWGAGTRDPKVKTALTLFAVQLALNVLWSALFFGAKSPLAAFVEIVILWVAILLTILSFSRVSMTAAMLLVPYILWVNFAAILNFHFWRLNP